MRIEAEASLRGALFSSGLIVSTRKLIQQEYDVRAMLAWQIVARAIAAAELPLSDSLAQMAKSEVRSALDTHCADLRDADARALKRMSEGQWPPHNDLLSMASKRAESEIDFALLAASRSTRTPADVGTTVNIFNPIGVVRTGAGSSAALTQALGSTEREVITRALAAIRDAVEDSSEVRNDEREPVLAVVSEAEGELESTRPNLVRLRGLLSGLAASVQTLGSARAAYELLKGPAALIGLQFP